MVYIELLHMGCGAEIKNVTLEDQKGVFGGK